MRSAAWALLAALCGTSTVSSQEPRVVSSEGPRVTAWEFGVASLGEDGHLLQVGYRASWLRPRSVGVDVSIASSPVALMALLVHGAIDLDAAYELALDPGVTLVGRAGGTALVWAGPGGSGLATGYNVGFGLVGRGSGRGGIRVDVVRRWFPTKHETHSVTSFTIGIAVFR